MLDDDDDELQEGIRLSQQACDDQQSGEGYSKADIFLSSYHYCNITDSLIRLLAQLQARIHNNPVSSLSSSRESLPSLNSSQLLATPPSGRVVYPPPLFQPSCHNNESHRDEGTFNVPIRPSQEDLPMINVPASMLNDHPVVTNPPEAEDDDHEFYEQLQQALTLSLIENGPQDNNQQQLSQQQLPQQQLPQQQPPQQEQQQQQMLLPPLASPDHHTNEEDYDEDGKLCVRACMLCECGVYVCACMCVSMCACV